MRPKKHPYNRPLWELYEDIRYSGSGEIIRVRYYENRLTGERRRVT